jgi:hypothetical protein
VVYFKNMLRGIGDKQKAATLNGKRFQPFLALLAKGKLIL